MSLLNTTGLVISFFNSTIPTDTINDGYYGEPEGPWMERLRDNWEEVLGNGIGIIMCIYIAYLSLFNKKIIGDYKWFILNQAIANFLNAFGNFLYYILVSIGLGMNKFVELYSLSDAPPLWLKLFMEIVGLQLQNKFGFNAQMTTLLATIINRWVAIVLPQHYSTIMKPRLIPLYCLLCYLVLLPVDSRLYDALDFSDTLSTVVNIAPLMIPWFLSIILSATIGIRLWMIWRGVSNAINAQRLRDHRHTLYAILIQTFIPLFDKISQYTVFLGLALNMFTYEDIGNSPIAKIFGRISRFNYNFTNVYTCLAILLTLRLYREAMLSNISPLVQLFKRRVWPYDKEAHISTTVLVRTTPTNSNAT